MINGIRVIGTAIVLFTAVALGASLYQRHRNHLSDDRAVYADLEGIELRHRTSPLGAPCSCSVTALRAMSLACRPTPPNSRTLGSRREKSRRVVRFSRCSNPMRNCVPPAEASIDCWVRSAPHEPWRRRCARSSRSTVSGKGAAIDIRSSLNVRASLTAISSTQVLLCGT